MDPTALSYEKYEYGGSPYCILSYLNPSHRTQLCSFLIFEL